MLSSTSVPESCRHTGSSLRRATLARDAKHCVSRAPLRVWPFLKLLIFRKSTVRCGVTRSDPQSPNKVQQTITLDDENPIFRAAIRHTPYWPPTRGRAWFTAGERQRDILQAWFREL